MARSSRRNALTLRRIIIAVVVCLVPPLTLLLTRFVAIDTSLSTSMADYDTRNMEMTSVDSSGGSTATSTGSSKATKNNPTAKMTGANIAISGGKTTINIFSANNGSKIIPSKVKGHQKIPTKKVHVDMEASGPGADFIKLKKGNNNIKKKKTKPSNKIAVVVSHYNEWLQRDNNDKLVMKPPDWARTDVEHSNYDVPNIYQKLDPNKPYFVPNHGFESGTYMKYIIDNYDRLPEVVVFTQADACHVDMDAAMERLTVDLVQRVGGYFPLNCAHIKERTFSLWRGWKPKVPNELNRGRRVEDCMRQVASDWGRGDIFDGLPYGTWGPGYDPTDTNEFTMSFICCACFAVTRERMKQLGTHEKWTEFYNRTIVHGECVPGRKDLESGKSEIGGAMEHLAHVIFGGHDADWKEPVCLANRASMLKVPNLGTRTPTQISAGNGGRKQKKNQRLMGDDVRIHVDKPSKRMRNGDEVPVVKTTQQENVVGLLGVDN